MADDPAVLVFGDLIDDVVVVPRGPIQPDTDTPSAISMRPGGSAANTASWLAATGIRTAFVARCGERDVERHATALRELGVEPRLIADPAAPTGTIVVIVEGEQRSMLTERGANAALSPADIDPAGFDLVHATGYSLPDHPEEFARLVARAHDAGVRVSLTAGSVAAIRALGAGGFRAAARGADIFIANAAEAALLTGCDEPGDAALALREDHEIVVVTAGSRGAVVADGRAPVRVAPVAVAHPVDPTGAGDAFTAGLIAGILAHGEASRAAREATVLAARAVSAVGGRPG